MSKFNLLNSLTRKGKSNKRGSMLLLVLIMFCVALILISSALSITMAARDRFYVEAETSQERLTVTSVADTVVNAIRTQQITDTELDALADGNATVSVTGATKAEYGSPVSSDSGTDLIPGIAGTADSHTTIKFSRDGDYIVLDISTLINATGEDNQTENVRVYLKEKPPTPAIQGFSNYVTCGAEGTVNSTCKYNCVAKDGYSVFHGDVDFSSLQSGCYSHNKTVFTGEFVTGNGTLFYDDVIFYGPDASIDVTSAGNGVDNKTGTGAKGAVFFIGNENGIQNMFVDGSGNPTTLGSLNIRSNEGMYVEYATGTIRSSYINVTEIPRIVASTEGTVDSYMQWQTTAPKAYSVASTGYVETYNETVSGNSYVAKSDPVVDAMKSRAADFVSGKKTSLATAAARTIPSKSDAIKQFGVSTLSELEAIAASSGSIAPGETYTAGTYYMNNTNISADTTFDLTDGDITVYCNGNITFNIGAAINVINDNDVNFCYFILLPNATMKVPNSCSDSAPTGIVSTEHQSGTGGALGLAVSNSKPACIIYGIAGNTFSCERGNTVDAYIGLYGLDSDVPGEGGTIIIKDKANFYGRLECSYLDTGGSDDTMIYPCPDPNETPAGTRQRLISEYEVIGYEYYY